MVLSEVSVVKCLSGGVKAFAVCLALLATSAHVGALPPIAEGDLVFVVASSANAITAVTSGVDSLPIDHVTIAHRIGGNGGPLYVIEALPDRGVVLTPIDSLMSRTQGQLLVGRVAGADVGVSVQRALRYVGRPYDFYYQPGAEDIYCSELVQLSYVDTSGCALFPTIAMTFCDHPGHIADSWAEHYRRAGLAVPEGAPGTNPAHQSRDPHVTIINDSKDF